MKIQCALLFSSVSFWIKEQLFMFAPK